MKKALILAAGFGSRLKPLTDASPKALVPVNGKPILEKQIESLLECGVRGITVVAGYKAEAIKAFAAQKFAGAVEVIENVDYAKTNNMYSAYLARERMRGQPFLMMNADVFFDASVIRALLRLPAQNAIVAELGRYLEESMKVAGESSRIKAISKAIPPSDALGTSIDVYKFSAQGGAAFFDKCAEYIEERGEPALWSEVALDGILASVEFAVCPLKGRWLEIDTLEDLAAAEKLFAREGDISCVDCFGRDASSLRKKRLFLLDMDGTIYTENRLFEGALDLLAAIKALGGEYVFLTNNSSKSVKEYLAKTRSLGISAEAENFFTSTQAAIMYLKGNHRGAKVYCQGTAAFVQELREGGINVTESVCRDIDVILVGFDTELTAEKIRKTCELLPRGLPYIATNPDLACPASFGYVPDCGSMCQMYENTTSRKPLYLGKPAPEMIDAALAKFGASKEDAVIIGDRLYTDIAAGESAGVDTACVLTGEATIAAIEASAVKPTYTFGSVKSIYECLAGLPVTNAPPRCSKRLSSPPIPRSSLAAPCAPLRGGLRRASA